MNERVRVVLAFTIGAAGGAIGGYLSGRSLSAEEGQRESLGLSAERRGRAFLMGLEAPSVFIDEVARNRLVSAFGVLKEWGREGSVTIQMFGSSPEHMATYRIIVHSRSEVLPGQSGRLYQVLDESEILKRSSDGDARIPGQSSEAIFRDIVALGVFSDGGRFESWPRKKDGVWWVANYAGRVTAKYDAPGVPAGQGARESADDTLGHWYIVVTDYYVDEQFIRLAIDKLRGVVQTGQGYRVIVPDLEGFSFIVFEEAVGAVRLRDQSGRLYRVVQDKPSGYNPSPSLFFGSLEQDGMIKRGGMYSWWPGAGEGL